MTCKDCIHYDVCKALEEGNGLALCDADFCGCYKDKSKFIELPCKVGDRVAVRATCECVYTIHDYEECRSRCPFEDECECDSCNNNNERIFVTIIDSIFNTGLGWTLTFKNLSIEARLEDLGTSFFVGENAEQQAIEYEKLKERERNA